MRILLDQNVPAILRRFLFGHTTFLSSQMGWSELSNGVLIRAAEREGFDVLVTGDKNIPHQQNLSDLRIALVILGNNSWPVLEPRTAAIVSLINGATPGSLISVPIERHALRRRQFKPAADH
jgi:hypothetical protein